MNKAIYVLLCERIIYKRLIYKLNKSKRDSQLYFITCVESPTVSRSPDRN